MLQDLRCYRRMRFIMLSVTAAILSALALAALAEGLSVSQETSVTKLNTLSDAEKKTINAYGIVNAEEHGGIAKPATFLIDKEGKIRFIYVGKTGADRPDDAITLSEIEKLTKR